MLKCTILSQFDQVLTDVIKDWANVTHLNSLLAS